MHDVKKNKSPWVSWPTVAILVVFVAYPLSMGPAIWVVMRCAALAPGLEIIYTPLGYLAGHFPPSGRAICEAYLGWWADGPVSIMP